MQILDVVSADNNSGEVTFKVLPVNIASESFAAGGLKPMYDVGMTDGTGSNIRRYNDPDPWAPSLGLFRAEDPLDENNTLTMPVWRLEDLQAWQSRNAFAVQLRMYHFHNYLIKGKDDDDNLVFSDFEDELASPYTTLYPNVMDPITLLPGAYVTGADGNPVPVAGNYEYQYLPYDVLRQNGTSAEPGYRVILDGATPAFSIDGKIVSAEDAYKMGYMVYGTGIKWDGFTYSSESLENLVVGTGQVYAEVEMNPEKSAAERKAAIGGKITGKYTLFIPVTARLFKYTGSDREELTTRFTKPKASVKYPSEMLDYSSFAIVPWVPFDNIESDDFRVVLDEHKVYRVPLGQNLELQDQRPNGVSYYVIKDGEWVIGNVAEFDAMAGTYQSDGNGYISGVSAKDAYHLGNLVFDTESVKAAIPADFKRLVSIVYSTNGLDFFSEPMDGAIPYLSIDYTSQVTFSGTIAIPVHVELPNPWQPALETDYTIYIVGYTGSSGSGTAKTALIWSPRRSLPRELRRISTTSVSSDATRPRTEAGPPLTGTDFSVPSLRPYRE